MAGIVTYSFKVNNVILVSWHTVTFTYEIHSLDLSMEITNDINIALCICQTVSVSADGIGWDYSQIVWLIGTTKIYDKHK